MALPKEKVKARLTAKYPGVNLSNKRVAALADKLKLEQDADDSLIDEKLDELNDVYPFSDLAKNDDRLATLEKKEKEKKVDTEDPKKEDKETDQTDLEKVLGKVLAPLLSKIEALEAGKTTDTRTTQLNDVLKDTDEKFKSLILSGYKRAKFDSAEAFEEYLEEVKTQTKDFIQADADEKLSNGSVLPILGVKNKTGVSSATADYVANKKAEQEGKSEVSGKVVFQT